MTLQINIKRVYVKPEPNDGYRVLVDRIWPRGVSKADACIDEWQKECAPSTELRKWFDHQSVRWEEFKRRYSNELKESEELVKGFVGRTEGRTLTLIYSAKNEQHNQAVVLREYIETWMEP